MKILFVQKEGGIFGAENYHLNIIPELMRHGIEVDFLRLYTNYQGGKGGAFIERLDAMKVRTFEINIGRILKLSNLFRINRIVKDGKYDVVHTHLIHADLHLALVKRLLNRRLKLVSTKHGYDNKFTSKYGFNAEKQMPTPYFVLSRFAERAMNKSFTITNALHRFFVDTGLTHKEKMSVIHYGFDLAESRADWHDQRYRIFPKQLIIAGRLVRFKGHNFVLEALPSVLRDFPDAGLVIAGSGDMETELRLRVHQLGLDTRVAFIGYTPDVPKWMFNSKIVLVPSVSEGFGVVLLEAFNVKRPVVAFDVPACNELIRNSVTGWLVPPYDIDQLGNTIKGILASGQQVNNVTEAAFKRLKEYFTLQRMVNETINFYKTI